MDPDQTQQAVEQNETYESIAGMIDYALLRPELSEDEVAGECRRAREYGVGAVVVRPSDVDQVLRWMGGSAVRIASTVGYPDGSSSTAAKLYEGRDLLRRGAKELDMVINVGKMISRQFQYVEMEILQMAKSCQESGAVLKVMLRNALLTDDLKIITLKICKRVEAPFLSLDYSPEDLDLLRPLLKERIQIKAASGAGTLEQVLELRRAGCTRIGSPAPFALLDEWRSHLAQAAGEAANPA